MHINSFKVVYFIHIFRLNRLKYPKCGFFTKNTGHLLVYIKASIIRSCCMYLVYMVTALSSLSVIERNSVYFYILDMNILLCILVSARLVYVMRMCSQSEELICGVEKIAKVRSDFWRFFRKSAL